MKTFTQADEPITTREIAQRLNETVRRVRETYVALARREPDNLELKPLANWQSGAIALHLNAVTANRIAARLEELEKSRKSK